MTDYLVLAPHPDDAEIHLGAAIAAWTRQGRSVVVCDATDGGLGSRGTVAERSREAAAAAEVLGLAGRENLGLPDGGLSETDLHQRAAVVAALRRHRPRAVLAIHPHARHSDHIALGRLAERAVKMAALHRLQPETDPPVAGLRLWWYEAELPLGNPRFLLPSTEEDWERKRAAIACYGSQLARPDGGGPPTSIATPEFLTWIEARGRAWGFQAGAPYAEAGDGPEALRLNDLVGK